jgi:hypothetical protein
MGTKHDVWRVIFVACGILALVLGHSFQAEGQVIIREKMEIKSSPKSHEKSRVSVVDGLELPRSLFYLGGSDYLVLRNGELSIKFNEAYTYRQPLSISDSVVVTIKKPNGDTLKQQTPLLPYLPQPLTLRDNRGLCTETQYSYSMAGEFVDLRLERSKGEAKIVELNSIEALNSYHQETMRDDNTNLLSYDKGHGSHYYESAGESFKSSFETKTFFEFDLSTFQTNGIFSGANLTLHQTGTDFSHKYDSLGTFSIGKVNGSWGKQTITWNNQPSTRNHIELNTSDRTVDGRLTVAVSDIVRSWFREDGVNNGLSIQAETNYSSASFYGFSVPKPHLNAVLELNFDNPHSVPQTTVVDIAHIEAGSVISFETEGISKGGDCGTSKIDYSLLFEEDNPDAELSIDVRPDAEVLMEGDTTLFRPVLEFANGIQRPFPDLQLYNVVILEGAEYGRLRDPKRDVSGPFLQEVYHDFEFVATDSLPADTSEVTAEVGVAAELGNTRVDGGVPTTVAGVSEPNMMDNSSKSTT